MVFLYFPIYLITKTPTCPCSTLTSHPSAHTPLQTQPSHASSIQCLQMNVLLGYSISLPVKANSGEDKISPSTQFKETKRGEKSLKASFCYHRVYKKKNPNKAIQKPESMDNAAPASNALCVV